MTRSKHEGLLIALIVAAGIAGATAFLTLREHAFPYSGLDLRVSKSQVRALADDFLKRHGQPPENLSSTITFDYDSDAKDFLEKTLDVKPAARLMRERISVWRWQVRYYKPGSRHEYFVRVSPDGRIVGYEHRIPEEAKGDRLTRSAALATAREFLRTTAGIDISSCILVESSIEKRPRRLDHFFEWADPARRVRNAQYRISAEVAGADICGFRQYLKVPEKFTEAMGREQAKGEDLYSLAQLPSVLLGVAAVVWFIVAVRDRRVRWRFAAFAGGAVSLVVLAAAANSIPLLKAAYDPMDSYAGFVASQIAFAILGAVAAGLGVGFLAATGGDAYARAFRDRQPLDRAFSLQGLLSREFAVATVVGYALAGYQLGYVTIFYIAAQKWARAWVPAEIPYDDTLSTAIPWIYPLLIGLSAALNEEFMFRLFAVSFLKRFLKSTWLAVIIPGVTWAFLHSNYPQQPYYIRGIEIGIHSIILGWVFVRFGIFSTIIAHYAYNAALGSVLLFRSSSPYFVISGALVILLMLAPMAVASVVSLSPGLRRRRSEIEAAEEARTVAESMQPPEAAAEPFALDYTPLSPRCVIRMLIAGAIALAALIAFARPGDRLKLDVTISRSQAYRLARGYLVSQGVKLKGFVSAASFIDETRGLGSDYVLRKVGRRALERLYLQVLQPALWTVTWQKPLSEERYSVSLTSRGRVYTWDHDTYEESPGANLSQKQALALAEGYQRRCGRDLSLYRLVSKNTVKRRQRTDHYFTWERTDLRFAHARVRTDLYVQGSKVYGLSDYIKVPEKYVQDEYRQTGKDTAIAIATALFGFAFALWSAVLFLLGVVRRMIAWRFALLIGALSAVGAMLAWITTFPTRYQGLGTTQSLAGFNYQFWQNGLLSMIAALMGGVFVGGLAEYLYRETFPGQLPVPTWYRAVVSWRPKGALALRQALGLAIVAIVILGGILVSTDRLMEMPAVASHAAYDSGIPDDLINSALPLLDGIATMLEAVGPGLLALVAVVCLAVRLCRRRAWAIGALVAVITLLGAGTAAKSWQEFGILSAAGLLGAAAAVWILATIRHNIAAYLIAAALAVGVASQLIEYSNTFLRANGIISLVLMLAVPAWVLATSWGVGEEATRDPVEGSRELGAEEGPSASVN